MLYFTYSGPSGILGSDGKQDTTGVWNCCIFYKKIMNILDKTKSAVC